MKAKVGFTKLIFAKLKNTVFEFNERIADDT